MQVKEPPSIDFDNVNENINSLSSTNSDTNSNGTDSDDAQLQRLARFALAVGSVMNSKGRQPSSSKDENEKLLNVRNTFDFIMLKFPRNVKIVGYCHIEYPESKIVYSSSFSMG